MLFEFILQLVSHERPPQKLRDIGRQGGSSELGQTSSHRRNAFPFRYRDRNGLTGAFAKTTRLKPFFIIQTIDPVVFFVSLLFWRFLSLRFRVCRLFIDDRMQNKNSKKQFPAINNIDRLQFLGIMPKNKPIPPKLLC